MLKLNHILTLQIEKFSLKGGGIAKLDGQVIFIPYTYPGDEVKVQISQVKKKWAKARVLEVLNPSPHRENPPCPYFGKCGGCALQHLSYTLQLKIKQEAVEFAAQRSFVKNNIQLPKFENIEKSPSCFGYRHRIRLTKKGLSLGYFREDTHIFVPVSHCLLAGSELNKKIFEFVETSEFIKLLDGQYEFELNGDELICLKIGQGETSFTQVNSEVNKAVHKKISNWLQDIEVNHFVDLYCGSGNLTHLLYQSLSHSNLKGYGVEVNYKAIEKAKIKYQEDRGFFKNVEWVCEDSGAWIKKQHKLNIDLICVDPPRSGLEGEIIDLIGKRSNLKYLLYMSCDLMTFIRDTEKLINLNPKWRISKIATFDMFPQTSHIEILSLFICK